MLGHMLKNLKCPVCLEGSLEYSQSETFEAFSEIFDLDDITEIVDGVIEQYLVFRCLSCEAKPRLRFKDIERSARESLTSRIMTLKARGAVEKAAKVRHSYYIYCGHCSGFDGRGSCPKKIYDDCGLKKVPNVL